MFGGGRGPMGGGGGMLRVAGRALTRTGVANNGIQEPFTSSPASGVSHGGGCAQKLGSSTGSNNLTISAELQSGLNLPVSPTSGWIGGPFSFVNSGGYEDFEWVSDEGTEEDGGDSVFGSVPSVDEVQDAVSALKQVFDGSSYSQLVRDRYESYPPENSGAHQIPIATGMVHQAPSFGTDLDWMEPSMQLYHSKPHHHHHAYDQVFNAFDLLRTEPSVQRMVMSLSSDKSVWDAVMNNEVVKEIKEMYKNDITDGESSDDTPGEENNNAAMDFIKWVFDNTMVKANEVFEKITKVVTELFNSYTNKKEKDAGFNNWLEEKLRTSVLLSIVVLLVVMVSRACNRS